MNFDHATDLIAEYLTNDKNEGELINTRIISADLQIDIKTCDLVGERLFKEKLILLSVTDGHNDLFAKPELKIFIAQGNTFHNPPSLDIDEKDLMLLEYLSGFAEPVKITKSMLPTEIRIHFSDQSLTDKDGLSQRFLQLQNRGFVKNPFSQMYKITPDGKEALKYERKRHSNPQHANISHTTIGTQVFGHNYGVAADHSSFGDVTNAPNLSTTNMANANSQKSFWHKISHFIMSNIWYLIIGLVLAYIIYYFGWN